VREYQKRRARAPMTRRMLPVTLLAMMMVFVEVEEGVDVDVERPVGTWVYIVVGVPLTIVSIADNE
jgi:hypothetical protein